MRQDCSEPTLLQQPQQGCMHKAGPLRRLDRPCRSTALWCCTANRAFWSPASSATTRRFRRSGIVLCTVEQMSCDPQKSASFAPADILRLPDSQLCTFRRGASRKSTHVNVERHDTSMYERQGHFTLMYRSWPNHNFYKEFLGPMTKLPTMASDL